MKEWDQFQQGGKDIVKQMMGLNAIGFFLRLLSNITKNSEKCFLIQVLKKEINVITNRKLIGARYFNKGYEAALGRPLDSSNNTARDTNGHGTHTLSTAGGRFVSGANFLGSAYGTAKGGSPNARVASYKVCWTGCYDADILAAFDAAIQDGVDILSISIGRAFAIPYFRHGLAIGSFQAVMNGILVVCSAGNSGQVPGFGTTSNVAPWILTVAASTIDREFPSNVVLGNNKEFKVSIVDDPVN
jgi:subtilisin family serine protease